ncbi:MAG: ribosome maturation factor RimM [Anaerolineales bacterium]
MNSESEPSSRSASRARRASPFLVVGRIVRPHGLRGLVIVETPMDLLGRLPSQAVLYLGADHQPAKVESLQIHQGRVLMGLEGCASREGAEALRETVVSVLESDLAPLASGEHYREDVVGLAVKTEDGEMVGRIERILPSAAHDLFEVRQADGSSFLLPASEAFVLALDPEAGTVTVRLIPGLRPGE